MNLTRHRFFQEIKDRFNKDEIRELCFGLGINPEDLNETTITTMVESLLLYTERHGLITDLISLVEVERPELNWSEAAFSTVDCPYRGLLPFREEDAHLFYGRDAYINSLLERIKTQQLVAVIGPSGSGKSSVVFAGLIPRLRHAEKWQTVTFRPGKTPFSALTDEIIHLLEPDLTEREQLSEANKLSEDLSEGSTSLLQVMNRIVKKIGEGQQLLLIIDQFEEVYTQCNDTKLREGFIKALLNLQASKSLTVVLTIRADFLGEVLSFGPFAKQLQKDEASQMIGPMDREDLIQVIERPLSGSFVSFEPGLTTQILDDVGDEAGNLPLLEFALASLWDEQADGKLTFASYERIGKVEGALTKHADTVYRAFEQKGDGDLIRRLFVQLVQPVSRLVNTKRKAWRRELGDELWDLTTKLADARLVVTNQDEKTQEDYIELAHEALITNWQQLEGWIQEDWEFRAWQERLRISLRQWKSHNEDGGFLLLGAPLAVAEEWLAKKESELNAQESTFIKASIEAENRRREKEDERQKKALEQAQQIAEQQANLAEEQRLRAEESEFRQKAEIEARKQAIARAREAEEAEKAQRKISTRLRRSLYGLTIILIVAIGAALIAVLANRQSTARRLMVEAPLRAEEGKLRLASLIAAEVGNRDSNLQDQTWYEVISSSLSPFQEVGAFKANSSEITDLAWHADGQKIASASCNDNAFNLEAGCVQGEIIIWDVTRGAETATIHGHEGQINGIDWHPEDDRLVSVSKDDGTVRIWDGLTGEQVEVSEFDDYIYANQYLTDVAWHPDGNQIAISACEQECDQLGVIIWDTENDEYKNLNIVNYDLHDTSDISIEWHPEGRILLLSKNDGLILLDIDTGEPVPTRPKENHVWDPTGEYVASTGYNVYINDAITGEEIKVLEGIGGEGESLDSLSWHPDGHLITSSVCRLNFSGVCAQEGALIFWDVASGEKLAIFDGYKYKINNLNWNPSGNYLATGDSNGVIRIWEASMSPELADLSRFDGSSEIFWDPDGNHLGVITSDSDCTSVPCNKIIIWDVKTGYEKAVLEGYNVAAWDPEGEYLALSSGDLSWYVDLWDVETGQISNLFEEDEGLVVVVDNWGDPNSDRLLPLASQLEVANNEILNKSFGATLSFDPYGYWDPTGKRIAFASHGGSSLTILEVATGKSLSYLEDNIENVRDHDWSADGDNLFVLAEDGTVFALNTLTGEENLIIRRSPDQYVTSIKALENDTLALTYWSPEWPRFVQRGTYENYHIWDIERNEEIDIIEDQSDEDYNHKIWSPNGKYLATAFCEIRAQIDDSDSGYVTRTDQRKCEQGRVILWDVINRTISANFDSHKDVIESLAWHPDRDYIATASCSVREEKLTEADKQLPKCIQSEIVIWDPTSGMEIAYFNGFAGIITNMIWQSGGERLAILSDDGTVQILNTSVGCDRILSNFTPQEWQEIFGSTVPYRLTCPDLPAFNQGAVSIFEAPFLTYGRWMTVIGIVIFSLGALVVFFWLMNRRKKRKATNV